LEYILRNAVLAILDFPGSTLLGVVRMLSDKNYRKRVVANIKDPVVKAFWEKEFTGYADKFAAEAVSPIQNKVGQFLSSSLMRNVIGQVRSSINIRDIMDNGKILIMNLSKGRIGEDNSALLGAMMITKIQLAAMSRVDVPEKERRDFYLYIDEFQNFSTDSFANILSEARKYRLNLILAHQYIEQLSEKVKPAVFGNVGTMVVFRVGALDAEELVKEFTPTFTEEDIVNLPKYEMYLKLMIDGLASSPFSAKGLPPLAEEEKTGNGQKVINYSREKYASDRVSVEEKIMRWHEGDDDDNKMPATRVTGAAAFNPTATAAAPAAPRTVSATPRTVPSATRTAFPAPRTMSPVPGYRPVSPRPTSSLSVPARQAVTVAAPITATALTASRTVAPGPNSRPLVKSGYEAICANCGRTTSIVFIPDGIRPVYCKDCLTQKKEEKRLELEERHSAKQKEKEILIAEAAQVAAAPALSLADLKKIAPVDFRGRTIKTEKIDRPASGVAPTDSSPHFPAPEKDLSEGEEVIVVNNNF
jgi:CxxC-x17-CxxC domain-containing protein